MQDHDQHELRDPESFSSLNELREEIARYANAKPRDGYRAANLYRQALRIPDYNVDILTEIICRYLLPDCVRPFLRKPTDLHPSDFRDVLSDWLDAMPEPILWQVRPRIISEAIALIELESTPDAIFTLSTIGYRDQVTLGALFHVAMSNAASSDIALRLLAHANDSELRPKLSARIRAKLDEKQITEELLHAIAVLGEDDAPDVLARYAKTHDDWFTFARYSWLCDSRPGDVELQERVLDQLVELADSLEKGWAKLIFSGYALAKCRTPRLLDVVAAKLPWIAKARGLFQLDDRFAEINRPVQLIKLLDPRFSVDVSMLAEAASSSTEQEGAWTTLESGVKDGAWQTALFLGSDQLFAWVENGISLESNHLQQHHLMELLSIFSLPHLPARCIQMLSDQSLAFERGKDDARLFPFLAAAGLAASRLTIDSLRLLLDAAGLIDGTPFRSPVDGAAQLACWLYENGDSQAVIETLEEMQKKESPMARSGYVRCLHEICSRNKHATLPESTWNRLLGLAKDKSAKPHLRIEAMYAFAKLDAIDQPERSTLLVELMSDENPQVKLEAANALAGTNPSPEKSQLIENYWNSRKGGTSLTVESLPSWFAAQDAYLLGRLSMTWPSMFLDDAVAVIGHKFTLTTHHVIQGAIAQRRHVADAPAEFVDAIVNRLREGESPFSASLPLMQALAILALDKLIAEPWENYWDDWLPDSRVAIVDVIASAVERIAVSQKSRAIDICTLLLRDSVFAVRRSAGRCLSRIDPDALRNLCKQWIGLGSIKARVRAAEAATWMAHDDESTLDNVLQRHLLSDPERRVREAAKRSRDDLQRREAALELRHLLAEPITEDFNSWVLRHYAIGLGLARIGDDFDARQLRKLIDETRLAPPVHRFFNRILDALDKQWKETTQKWPEPWLPWTGYIEECPGELKVGDQSYPCRFSLWQEIGEGIGNYHSWGGAVFPTSTQPWWTFGTSHTPRVEIHIANRLPAEALIINAGSHGIILSGTGPYPDRL